MKDITGRLQDLFMEIAFAEERDIRLLKNISGRFAERLDKLFAAITFAEAGEFDTARIFLSGRTGDGGRSAGYCLRGFCVGRA